jgi:hypothetical protein
MWNLLLFSFQVFAVNTTIEPKQVEPMDSEEMELANDCKRLAKAIGSTDKRFPLGDVESIEGLVTWWASRCEKRPKGTVSSPDFAKPGLRPAGDFFSGRCKRKKESLIRDSSSVINRRDNSWLSEI